MLVTTIYILIIFYIIQKWSFFQINGINKIEFHLAFVIKVFAGFILYLFYTKYYQQRHLADIFKFYDDSRIISDSFLSHPLDFFKLLLGFDFNSKYLETTYYINMNHWDTSYSTVLMNESRLIIRINSILNLIGLNNYSFNAVSFLLIGYLGTLMIIKSFLSVIRIENKRLLFWTTILFPSIILWTSGILKEPLTFLALGLILYGLYFFFIKKINIKLAILFLIVGLSLLFMIKFYVFICFFTSLSIFFIIKKKSLNPLKAILAFPLLILILILFASLFTDQYNPIYLLSRKQNDFILLAEYYGSGSYFYLKPIENSIYSFIQALPIGLFNGVFRPLPTDISKAIHLLPFIENIILLSSIIWIILRLKKTKPKIDSKTRVVIYCSLLFAIFLFTITGMSTPVIGALVRYKIPGLLFIIISINIIYDQIQSSQKSNI